MKKGLLLSLSLFLLILIEILKDHGLYREGATPSGEGTADGGAPGDSDAPLPVPRDSSSPSPRIQGLPGP